MQQVERTVLWSRLDGPGCEYCSLWRTPDGWQIRGTVVMVMEGVPARIRYGVLCDPDWRTRAVHVGMRCGGPERALHLIVDQDGRWWIGGEEVAPLRGCFDVDLEISPATNTLPVRRLGLGMHGAAEIEVAWVHFPALSVEASAQRYTRLDPTRYLFEALASGYRAQLTVDDAGLVVDYPGGWRREGVADAANDSAASRT
ncbi:MAG: putative glycolipid-binding domain-containing protein [Chloroflexi bacterium]|nr:putative glycolipid-binding domain-containing protein [Chloroflexota bacterium]